jgi:hypothetical protein
MSIKKRVWISYDLGIVGDYESLYWWLDEQNAKECGLNVATFELEVAEENLVSYLQENISKQVKIEKNNRLYLIYLQTSTGKMKGEFLFGSRKRAIWQGYAMSKSEEIDS